MSDLRERLDDLVADIPSVVVPDIAAARAAGDRRRRTRRGVGATLAVAVGTVLGVLTTGLMTAPDPQPAEGPGSVSVSGYPERVTAPWWIRDLPNQTEPMAGLFEADGGAWFALGERGQVYRLDFVYTGSGNYPSLSPDGTKIAYIGHDWQAAIRDVVTGEVVTFPSVSGGKEIAGATLFWTAQAPAAWSPDGTHVLVQGGSLARGKPQYRTVVLGTDGTVAPSEQDGNPAGWLDDDRALLFNSSEGTLATIDRTGHLLGAVVLQGLEKPGRFNQFSPRLSVDAQALSLTSVGDITQTARTTTWDPATGDRLPGTTRTPGISTWCPSSRTPDTITLASGGYDSALNVGTVGDKAALVLIDPSLQPTCAVFADHALAGNATGSPVDRVLSGVAIGPLETPDLRDTWVAWHLRYAGLLLIALLTLVLVRAARQRTKRRRASTSST